MTEPTFEEIDALAREIAGWDCIGPDIWSAMDGCERNHYRALAVGVNMLRADPTPPNLPASLPPRPLPKPTSRGP
jgi:hypothetical protein